ncbi:hypothetical protein SLOPH_2401 [Spraguea lophii 42_110]|uniref:Uncharacterized protein n=1 Tax=Spraguea lophii (strain 42_110) TaxID=1358809 RepID=S7XQ01_SPRLO|nr:hypothetical protein SLOPH_2401 [Spraguea lophii 42_110]
MAKKSKKNKSFKNILLHLDYLYKLSFLNRNIDLKYFYKLSNKYQIKIPKEVKRTICKKCYKIITTGEIVKEEIYKFKIQCKCGEEKVYVQQK